MKALTLHRPWPWVIFYAPPHRSKRIENRTWRPPAALVGQRFAIHAGKTFDHDAEAEIMDKLGIPAGLPYAAFDEGIIGTAVLVGVISSFEEAVKLRQEMWWCGPFAWVLDDRLTFHPPVPSRGHQGLWNLGPILEEQLEGCINERVR